MPLILLYTTIFAILFIIDPAMAQEFGEAEGARNFLEWLTGPIAVIFVAAGIFISILVALFTQSIENGIRMLVAVLVIGGLVGLVLTIAEAVVGAGG